MRCCSEDFCPVKGLDSLNPPSSDLDHLLRPRIDKCPSWNHVPLSPWEQEGPLSPGPLDQLTETEWLMFQSSSDQRCLVQTCLNMEQKKKRRDNEWNQIPRTEPLSHRSAAARLTFLVTGVKDSANISCSCCHAGVYSQCQCCCRWTTDRLTTDVYSSNCCWSLSFFYCFKCFLSWDSFWFPSGLSAQTSDLWSGRWSLSLQTTSVVVQDRQISRSLKTHSGFLLF